LKYSSSVVGNGEIDYLTQFKLHTYEYNNHYVFFRIYSVRYLLTVSEDRMRNGCVHEPSQNVLDGMVKVVVRKMIITEVFDNQTLQGS